MMSESDIEKLLNFAILGPVQLIGPVDGRNIYPEELRSDLIEWRYWNIEHDKYLLIQVRPFEIKVID